MENKVMHPQSKAIIESQTEIVDMLSKYFNQGSFEHHLSLVGNAITDIIDKGADDRDESLDNEFEHTNRYIRESVYDLVELQKFLMRIHLAYTHHRQVVNNETNPEQTKAERLKMTLSV